MPSPDDPIATEVRDAAQRSRRLVEQLLRDPGARAQLLGDANALKRLLGEADGSTLGKLLRFPAVREQLLLEPGLVKIILADPRTREILLDDSNFLKRIAGDARTLERILQDPALMRRLLADERSRDTLLADGKLRGRIARSDATREDVLNHPASLRRVVSDERATQLISTDKNILSQILGNKSAPATLAQIPSLFERLLAVQDVDFFARNRAGVRVLLSDPRLVGDADLADRLAANTELLRVVRGLSSFLPEDRAGEDLVREALRQIRHPNDVKQAFLDQLCRDDALCLAGARLRFPQRSVLWILIEEILIAEEYYFPCDHDRPVIVDGGTNFGLSLYYFKRLYPRARITAFEPLPELHRFAVDNCTANDFDDVTVHRTALSDRDGRDEIFLPDDDTLGACLQGRRDVGSGRSIEVEIQKLSPYLQEPVDFLKLDIEGAEDSVLAECGDSLGNVRNLFCEYHQGPGRPSRRMATVLAQLESCGFDVVVGKSRSCATRTAYRPLLHATAPYSACIWAVNRNPPRN